MKRCPWLRLVPVLAFTLGFALPGRAEDNPMQPAAPAPVHFLRVDPGLAARVLPEPPAPGSLAAAADLDVVLEVQAVRTPEQVAWARVVEKNDLFAVFGAHGPLGPQFTKENCPQTAVLVKHAIDDLRPPVDAAKKLYARARPYAVDARVQPCVELPANDSYPSGHAWNALVRAEVLAAVLPEKRAELLEHARRIAWARVLGGVHFPTDLEGGRRLAAAAFAELATSPAFQAAVAKCRAEAAPLLAKKKAA